MLWSIFGSASLGGPAEDVVDQVLGAYLKTCSQAFFEPAIYLQALTIPGPSGERVVTTTPDGQIVWVTTSNEDLLEDVQIAGVPGTLQITCVLTKNMITPISDGASLTKALRDRLSALSSVSLVGGSAPQDTPGVVYGSTGFTPVGDSHVLAASGLFEDINVVTQFEAHTNYFAISGLHRLIEE
ncbi:MAG: hypothetical protein AAFY74_01555 [Pseudomonadota bacterium]